TQATPGGEKQRSLSTYVLHIQARLSAWNQTGRKHWDLYRWLLDPVLLVEAVKRVLRNDGSAGLDGATCESLRGREWEYALSLSQRLRSRAYRPGAVRRVFIPKR